jgi:mannose PTS system EIID component
VLRSTFLRSLTIQGSWNYRTMLGGGMAFALLPLLRRTRGETGPELEAALARHSGHFNAHPYLAGLALGAVARLELLGEEPDVVERFKAAVRGPLGGIGDALVWTGWLPTTLLVTLAAAWCGLPAYFAVPLFLLLYNAGHLGLRMWAFRVGLEEGAAVGGRLRQAALGHRAELLFRAGAALIGLLGGVLLASPKALASGSLYWVLLAILGFGIGVWGGQRVWRPTALTVVGVIVILFLMRGLG